MPSTLSHAQAMRYNRQIVLPQIDLEGQERLLNGSALVLGVGGLGCASALSLCSSGLGNLILVDDDIVELHNLPRQILFNESDVGRKKVDAAKQALSQRNSECNISVLPNRLSDEELKHQIATVDVVLDCTDNMDSREQINRLCVELATPLVSGAAIRLEGQLFVWHPKTDAPCYQCLSHLIPPMDLSCSENGILGPVVTAIGTQQALLAVKILGDIGHAPTGSLQLFDAITHQWQTFKVKRQKGCPVCGTPSTLGK